MAVGSRDETLEAITRQRNLLLDTLEGVGPEAWSTPSLCEEWTVAHVLAHLLSLLEVPTATWARRSVTSRGFNRETKRLATEFAARPPAQLIAGYRERAGQRFAPPVIGPIAPLIDIHVHTLDIEVPLGIAPSNDEWGVRRSLDFLATPKLFGLVRQRVIDGVRLEADDLDWSHGSGPLVSGPASSLLLLVNQRRAGLAALRGPGVETLAGRMR